MSRGTHEPFACLIALAPLCALSTQACGEVLGTDFGDLMVASTEAGAEAGRTDADAGDLDAAGADASAAAGRTDADAGDLDAGGLDAGADASAEPPAPAFPATWSVLSAAATDVAAGATDDDLWILDTTLVTGAGGMINYQAEQWVADAGFQLTTTVGTAIDVTNSGPCVVMQDSSVWVSQAPGELVQLVGGVAGDIGSSASDVWVMSNGLQLGHPDELKVFRWTGEFAPNPFVQEPDSYGVHVDVAPDGSAWIARHDGGIFHATFSPDVGDYEPENIPIDGTAIDVGVGADGSVYALGQADGGTELFEYSTPTGRFERLVPIDGVRVSAGPSRIFVVLADGRLVASP